MRSQRAGKVGSKELFGAVYNIIFIPVSDLGRKWYVFPGLTRNRSKGKYFKWKVSCVVIHRETTTYTFCPAPATLIDMANMQNDWWALTWGGRSIKYLTFYTWFWAAFIAALNSPWLADGGSVPWGFKIQGRAIFSIAHQLTWLGTSIASNTLDIVCPIAFTHIKSPMLRFKREPSCAREQILDLGVLELRNLHSWSPPFSSHDILAENLDVVHEYSLYIYRASESRMRVRGWGCWLRKTGGENETVIDDVVPETKAKAGSRQQKLTRLRGYRNYICLIWWSTGCVGAIFLYLLFAPWPQTFRMLSAVLSFLGEMLGSRHIW